MLAEGSSVKGSPEDKQPSGPCIKESAKISRWVTQALYTGPLITSDSRSNTVLSGLTYNLLVSLRL